MIAKLTELENALRAKAGYVVGLRHGDGMQDAYNDAADRVATLIAELGQEVGADWQFKDPADGKWKPIPTSPAHTSEARDALRNLVKTVHTVAFSGDYGIDDDAIEALADALDDANAAMRQEGGTP